MHCEEGEGENTARWRDTERQSNNLKTERYKEQADGEAEKERQMAEKDSGRFSPAKILTSSDSDNRRCQPPDSLFLSVFFTLSLFISVGSVNFASDNLSLSG